jgi:hypothetical protein
MKQWQTVTLVVVGILVAIIAYAEWTNRGQMRDYYRAELNTVAKYSLGAACNSDNIRNWWELKQNPNSGVESAVVLGAEIWEISENVDWSDDRVDGDTIGPYRTIQKMDATNSRDEFFTLGDELQAWCSANWEGLFDADNGLMPVRD